MTTPDIIAFIRARFAEDEAEAQAVEIRSPSSWRIDGEPWPTNGVGIVDAYGDVIGVAIGDYVAVHIARHDPARVLADVEAKRRIIELAFQDAAVIDGEWGCCHSGEQIAAGQCPEIGLTDIETLRLLALPYADHPDYRPEWRP